MPEIFHRTSMQPAGLCVESGVYCTLKYMTGPRPCSIMRNMLSKGGLKFAKREPKIFCFCFAAWEPWMRKQKSLHYSLQVWFPPCPPAPSIFSFGPAANFILNFLNTDARSVLRKWCIYSVSASCAGRSRDVQLMGLPRKLGGRVLECFSGEWRGSSESVMTPGRGWCQENWFEQRREEEQVTRGTVCLAGGRVHKCETWFCCLQVLQMFLSWD